MTMAMPGANSVLVVTSEREPIIKVVRFKVISSLNNFTVLIPALKKEETVIPARIIVVRLLSAIYASAKIRGTCKCKDGIMGCTALEEGKPNHNGKSGSGIDTDGIRTGKGIIHNSL